MGTGFAPIGRDAERERLGRALDRARAGRGSLVLISGGAGLGKTRLVRDVAAAAGIRVLHGGCERAGVSPYGPIVAALRAHMRDRPDGLARCGPLRPHLALLLPELGDPPDAGDRATLVEAVCQGIGQLACDEPALLMLDDLQWSDDATLEALPAVAESIEGRPLLVVGAYRPDGLPRDHMLRRARHELRRAGRLEEVRLAPLPADETARLAAAVLGGDSSAELARAIHDRAQGIPFFVEELARALAATGSLATGPGGLRIAGDGDVPVPETIRDAVLIGVADLSPEGRAAADAAAVAGASFDADVVAAVAGPGGLAELVERGVVVEDGAGRAAFRHTLAREVLYADVPWLRRRALHRRLAEGLEAAGAPSGEVATHWLGARDAGRARESLLRAARELRRVHAYRDAARAGRRALDLWPEGAEPASRLGALEGYASCAELSGELDEAARAWREVCDLLLAAPGAAERLGDARRRLAGVHDLRGDRESAVAARGAAAEAYASAGCPADAAVERLGAANHLRARADYTPAIAFARRAQEEAVLAGRPDLRARGLGLEGVALAKRGDHAAGLATVRTGLAIAVEADLTPVVAELYQRLSLVLYDAGDYGRAEGALESALELCRAGGAPDVEVACVTCLVYVLRERGEWRRALALGRELIAGGTAVWVAEGLVGAIHGAQGRFSSARRLLLSSLEVSSRVGHFNMTVDSTAALACVAGAQGADEEAARRCRELLARWERSEDHHYAVRGLRWAAGFFARRGDVRSAHSCAEALVGIAARTGHPDALAAVAHAIAESALAEGDSQAAAERLGRAVELHRGLDMPLERAEIELRAGVALAAAGDREGALERLGEAYRAARRLGARPLAAEAAREVAALGESVARRLGRRAEADAEGAGLSRRELQVVRLVAVGRTNREIARELYLSPRTVDMHVRNILRRLGCRSRVEAAHRAGELGLLV